MHLLQIKQIGGRAGRAGGVYPVGEVTAMSGEDLAIIRKAMAMPSPQIKVCAEPPPAACASWYAHVRELHM
jgi:hypothetical protein